jgi:hypothetical protein
MPRPVVNLVKADQMKKKKELNERSREEGVTETIREIRVSARVVRHCFAEFSVVGWKKE